VDAIEQRTYRASALAAVIGERIEASSTAQPT
jgi:hypothetical protein